MLARLIVLLIGFPIHEWAHAWSADQLGDDTPRWQGRLSLNPLVHLDILGSLLLLLTGFGWAQPVPVNPNRMRIAPRSGMALSAFAGPASNLLVAMFCAIPFRLGWLHLGDVSGGASLLEPALLILMGAMVGLIAISFIVPIFKMSKTVG